MIRVRYLLCGHSFLDNDVFASGQCGSLAGDEGAVLGADHGEVVLGTLGALFRRLQFTLEATHSGKVGLGDGFLARE